MSLAEEPRILTEATRLIGAGRVDEALTQLKGALMAAPDSPRLLALAGHAAAAKHQFVAAYDYFRKAAAADGADGEDGAEALRAFLAKYAPHWHYFMLADGPRNRAYAQAIARAVRPGMTVLDIGAGAGLLSLMAARAGAKVVACELAPLIAAKAKQVIADNGLADRIELHVCHSGRLSVGKQLAEPADLLVTETFDGALLGEGALAAIHDAKARLLKPKAQIIPKGATVQAMLVESQALRDRGSVGTVEGFDLSAFDDIAPPILLHTLTSEHYRPLHTPQTVMSLDFEGRLLPRQKRMSVVKIEADGRADAVLFWFTLALDDAVRLSNAPSGPKDQLARHWSQAACLLRPPQPVRKGQRLTLIAWQSSSDLRFDVKA